MCVLNSFLFSYTFSFKIIQIFAFKVLEFRAWNKRFLTVRKFNFLFTVADYVIEIDDIRAIWAIKIRLIQFFLQQRNFVWIKKNSLSCDNFRIYIVGLCIYYFVFGYRYILLINSILNYYISSFLLDFL